MASRHTTAQMLTDSAGGKPAASERREFLEFFETAINLSARKCPESFNAEAFTTIASHHRAVNNGAANLVVVHAVGMEVNALAGEVAHEAAGEAIARAGG